ncbi:hypothetical protein RDD34_000952 [Salmonella enterica]|nr:hypothetical protein [Salmonella enterica]ELI2322004.1 hypothetical protein [Salmonella enterica]
MQEIAGPFSFPQDTYRLPFWRYQNDSTPQKSTKWYAYLFPKITKEEINRSIINHLGSSTLTIAADAHEGLKQPLLSGANT